MTLPTASKLNLKNKVTLIMKKISLVCLLVVVCSMNSVQARERYYSPEWESLARYEVPAWFQDAKFGIFIHWGVYSVPAYKGEWYPRNIYRSQGPHQEHHIETYGPLDKFGYKDFIPMFKAVRWDPVQWAELFKQSGARYVVPVAEHHDGFAMYDCSHTPYNAVNMGPKRDVVGELMAECRKIGLKAGVSSHRAFNWEYYAQEEGFDTYDPAYEKLYGKRRAQPWPDKDFVNDWYLRTLELAVKYEPDIFWFDFYLDQPELREARYRFAADYYNLSVGWGKDVVLQYKYDIYHPSIGVLDIERGKLSGIQRKSWQTDTAVSFRGWCYITEPDYKDSALLVHDLIDIVSKNGNLLLNVGPKPDGTIPSEQQDILRNIGDWLRVNGPALYGTRPWVRFGEGPTQTAEGAHQEHKNKGGTADDYRFTIKGDTLYAHCLGWPQEAFVIKSLGRTATKDQGLKIKQVSVLGSDGAVKWQQTVDVLRVNKPANKPCNYAYVIKVDLDGLADQMARHHKSLPPEPETLYCFPGDSLRDISGYTVRDGNLNRWEQDTVVRWNITVKTPGTYEIAALQRNPKNEKYILRVNNKEFRNPDQAPENKPSQVVLGTITFDQSGTYPLTLRSDPASEWHQRLSMKKVTLTRMETK